MNITIFKNEDDDVVDFADGRNYYIRTGCESILTEVTEEDYDTLQVKHKEKKVKFKDNKLEFK